MIDLHAPVELSHKIEQLTRRYEMFNLIRESHMRWMNETNDPKLREVHRAVVALFEALMEQYNVLLDAIQIQH